MMNTGVLLSQQKELQYSQHLTISDGLAHNGVTSIIEDSNGYLWFGTYEGLNRYDGYEVKTFKNRVGDKIFVSNRIRTIKEDSKGNIWIGTDEGISIYESENEIFRDIYSNTLTKKGPKGPIVRSITIDNESGNVLCGTEKGGVLVFNEDFTFKAHHIPPFTISGEQIDFYDVHVLGKGYFIYATSVGLLGFNAKNGQFQRILGDEITYSNAIKHVNTDTFIITLNKGLALVRNEHDNETFRFDLINKDILSSYSFNSAELDKQGKLWLGTLNDGAIRIDDVRSLNKVSVESVAHFKPDTGQLRISGFYTTKNKGFWMATYDKGLYRFSLKENPFKQYNGTKKYDFGVNNRHIRHLTAVDDRRIYMTTYVGELVLFNTETGKFEPIPKEISKRFPNNILAVFVDSNKNTWLRVRDEGYYVYNSVKKTINKIDTSTLPGFITDPPFKITEDKKGNIWLGCAEGAYRINLNDNGEVTHIEDLNSNPMFQNNRISLVRYAYSDPKYEYMWLGSAADGLFRIHLSDNLPLNKAKIDQYRNTGIKPSLPNNFVSTIERSPSGELWIGTEGAGISKVINCNTDPEFIPFSEKDDLSNNVVKSILFDRDENLWVATNIGLNKFFTDSQKFRRFRKEDGLPYEDFWYSSTRLTNGIFVLTGLEGFCYFNPKDISNQETLPNLQFGEIKILGQTIKPMDTIAGRILLTKKLSNHDTLLLNHNENVISLELRSLHFAAANNHFLKYQLSPIDENFIQVPSDQRILNYQGLQPGEYELSVSASNTVGEWTIPKIVHFIIAPPFWKTTQAYVLYTILAILILGSILFYVLKMQSLSHNIELQQLEKNKVKEVNAAKQQFFTNISHELKTPLNLIKSPIRILSEKFKGNADVSDKLNIVERQSQKIHHLINQVNDFERIEANLMEMAYSRFYFDTFMDELLTDFRFVANNSNRTLKFIGKNSDIVVSADRDKLEKVFNNLLSNAFKYTRANDTIIIEISCDEKDLLVSVTDTGQGIDKEDLPHIFERFYQSHKKQNIHSSGSGIGLAFSKRLVEMHYGYIAAESALDKGTSIHVRLPIVKKESELDREARERSILSAEKELKTEAQIVQTQDATTINLSGKYADSLVYYAEDNSDMRIYVSELLSKFYKIKTFNNGQECIDAMTDHWPDIVISDIQMPELNGLDLCKRIKSDIATSHIPVILLTALTETDDLIRGIRDGADAYIKKPFDVRRLVARIEALLENKKRLRERFEIGIPLTHDNNINNRNDNAFLEKLYHLMTENLDNQDLEIDEFARKLYLNRTHFYQKVKALTDRTPFELLKIYRLKKAAEFLASKNQYTVNEVYSMTGFKSRTHFSKLFKEVYGVTPGKFESAAT